MAFATSFEDTWDFILPEDEREPEEKRTVWTLGPLSAGVHRRILSLLDRDPGQGLYELVQHGVRGVRRLWGRDGEEVTLTRTKLRGESVLSDRSMGMISQHWMALGAELMGRMQLEEQDEGNSRSSPKSPPAE